MASAGHGDGLLKVWNLKEKRLNHSIDAHDKGYIYAVLFLADNQAIITSGSGKRSEATIAMWNVGTGKSVMKLRPRTRSTLSLALTKDDSRLASGSLDGEITIWDVESRESKTQFSGDGSHVNAMSFLSNDKLLVTISKTGVLRLWDAKKGELKGKVAAHPVGGQCNVAATEMGNFLVTCGGANVKVWTVQRKGR